ncbi:hypothetical protein H5J25_18045 [Sphingomonas aliaeris]|uniref:Uncharacterized protein n=1 Tax=Sphingomonas aliaeris TaxID=2759526 RepID=A0A974NUK2_9SPHN|nr:hypothetical protein [Sphingomonas aliaeris]QQV77195.1 hypothetical protein H5J25_18045 [Sphingomonas aliaeris]
MDKNDTLKKAGLAAVILLAPGGYILGATLAARYWQRRRAEGPVEDTVADDPGQPPA